MFQTKVLEKIKTHIVCSITFCFLSENCTFYEIMWKNIVDWDRSQMTIWCMPIICSIPFLLCTVLAIPCPYGFCNPVRIHGMRVNGMIPKAPYNTYVTMRMYNE